MSRLLISLFFVACTSNSKKQVQQQPDVCKDSNGGTYCVKQLPPVSSKNNQNQDSISGNTNSNNTNSGNVNTSNRDNNNNSTRSNNNRNSDSQNDDYFEEEDTDISDVEDMEDNNNGNNNDPGDLKLWINTTGQAYAAFENATPGTSEYDALEYIANTPAASWIGEWTSEVNPETEVSRIVDDATARGEAPILIIYAIPNRDCGQYSAGGISSKEAYLNWVKGFADGVGNKEAIVILEPDALGLLNECEEKDEDFDVDDQLDNLSQAITILTSNPNTYVYIDAGHWLNVQDVVDTILQIDPNKKLSGYSTNVSNYKLTSRMEQRCKEIYDLFPNDHKLPCVIDTSRNKMGGNELEGEASWCNPPNQGLGEKPMWINKDYINAYFWLKVPGESDGECQRDEPAAGEFWLEKAIELYEIGTAVLVE